MGTPPEQAHAQFIEDFAASMDTAMPRMAGRILAVLLLADEPELTAGQLGQRLGASSASISNMTRLLQRQGLIQRLAKPGVRGDLYRLAPDAWRISTRDTAQVLTRIVDLAAGALEDPATGGAAARRLTELRDFYGFLARELPRLIEAYDRQPSGETPS